MAIYEIKDPKPVPPGEGVPARRRNVKPVSPAAPIRPIDFSNLTREWGGENEHEAQDKKDLNPKLAFREAQAVIAVINTHLEMLQKGIHISLRKEASGYVLDVHDCSDGKLCDKVAELPIVIDDLPILLKRLQQEAGILLDKQL